MTQAPAYPHRRSVVPTYPVLLGIVFTVCTFGIGGLTLSLLGAWWFSRTEARAQVGAIVFGALAVPTIILFFSGTPGMFGATAAFLAGLTLGRTPATGAPRVFGIVGLVFAILNVLITVAGVSIAWITG